MKRKRHKGKQLFAFFFPAQLKEEKKKQPKQHEKEAALAPRRGQNRSIVWFALPHSSPGFPSHSLQHFVSTYKIHPQTPGSKE